MRKLNHHRLGLFEELIGYKKADLFNQISIRLRNFPIKSD